MDQYWTEWANKNMCFLSHSLRTRSVILNVSVQRKWRVFRVQMVLHFVWDWWWQFSDSIFIIKSIYRHFFEATNKCFHINGCFGHYFKSIVPAEPRWFFKNWERFFFITHLYTIKSLIFYPSVVDWENQSHLQTADF